MAAGPGPRDWVIGDVLLDLYEVRGVLGQGGMGRVYRVHHRVWGVDLAVKTPLPTVLEAAGGMEAFEREAETWVRLGLHPHVLTCHYVRRVDGLPRLFAECAEGGSLHEAIRAGDLSDAATILDLAVQVAWGLHHAHESGLVHQDVKPANVMLGGDGLAKVTDFGLAHAKPVVIAPGAGSGTVLVAGGGGGTPAYMSPEQSAGAALTRRSDLWSWGLVVLEMFAGERTWASGLAALDALREHVAHGDRPGRPCLPGEVAALLRSCFRDDPGERPHTMLDAAEVLTDAYAGVTGRPYPRTRPRGGAETADSLCNRGVSLLDLARTEEALDAWRAALARHPHHLETTWNTLRREWEEARLPEADLRSRLEAAHRAEGAPARGHLIVGRALLALGDGRGARARLEEAVRAGERSLDARRDLLAARCADLGRTPDPSAWEGVRDEARQLLREGDSDPGTVLALSLAAERLGDGREAGRVHAELHARQGVVPASLGEALAAWLPACELEGELKGVAGGSRLAVASKAPWAALGTSDGSVRLLRADSLESPSGPLQLPGPLLALAVSPDGALLVAMVDGAGLTLVEARSRRMRSLGALGAGLVKALAFSADGRFVLAGAADRTVRVHDLVASGTPRVLRGEGGGVTCVAGSPDGRLLAAGHQEGVVRVWDLAKAAAVGEVSGHHGRVDALVFTGAGKVASAGEDGTIRVFSAGSEPRVLRGHDGPVTSLALSADGSTLASGGADRTVRAWDLTRLCPVGVTRLDGAVQDLGAVAGRPALLVAAGNSLHRLLLPARRRPLPPFALARPVAAAVAVQRRSGVGERLAEAERRLGSGDAAGAWGLVREVRATPGYERSPEALVLGDRLLAALPRGRLLEAWESGAAATAGAACLSLCALDGGGVLAGGVDGRTWLWVGPGAVPRECPGHEGGVTGLALVGRGVVSAGRDGAVRLRDATGETVATLAEAGEPVTAMATAGRGLVLLARLDGSLEFLDVQSREVGRLALTDPAPALALFPSEAYALCAGSDRGLRVVDVRTRQAVGLLEGHGDEIGALAVSPDERAMASADASGQVRLWTPDGWRLRRLLARTGPPVTALTFSPDGRHLAAAARDGSLRVWDIAAGPPVVSLAVPAGLGALAWSPAGHVLFAGLDDGGLRAFRTEWDLSSPDQHAEGRAAAFLAVALRAAGDAAGVDPSSLATDLARRGFGGQDPQQLAGRIEEAARRGGSGPLPPPVGGVQAVAAAARQERRRRLRRFRLRRWHVAAGLAAAFVLALLVVRLLPAKSRPLALNTHAIRLLEVDAPGPVAGVAHEDCQDTGSEIEAFDMRSVECLAARADPGLVLPVLRRLERGGGSQAGRRRAPHGGALAVGLLQTLARADPRQLCEGARQVGGRGRDAALEAVVWMGEEGAGCFRELLAGGETEVRRAAARRLPAFVVAHEPQPEVSFVLLEQAARDTDPEVRVQAAEALPLFLANRQTRDLARTLAADDEPRVREAGARADRLLVGRPTVPLEMLQERSRKEMEGP